MTNEKLTKWEDRRRKHLGSTITLLFGLSSASLAFCGALLTKDSVKLGGWRSVWFLAAAISFMLTLLSSISVSFTRLQDVRTTAKIVRAEGESVVTGYIARLRSRADFWGKWTWRLLYIQLATFL